MDIYPKIESGLAGLEIGVLGILHICNLDDSGRLYRVIWFCPEHDEPYIYIFLNNELSLNGDILVFAASYRKVE